MRYINRQLNQILSESIEFDPDEALPDEDEFRRDEFVIVRSGRGTIGQAASETGDSWVPGFTDEVDRIWTAPIDQDGYQIIAYKEKYYQLHGGIRTSYFINLQNPVDL